MLSIIHLPSIKEEEEEIMEEKSWFLILTFVGTKTTIKVRGGLAVLYPGYYLLLEQRSQNGEPQEYVVQSSSIPTLEEAIKQFESWT